MTQAYLQELQFAGYAPRTLLDIGAHIGAFTRQFLEVFPGCAPTLIEPNPFCRADLSRLGFEQHAVAASDSPGRAELFLTKEWLQSTGTSLYRENTQFFRDEVVVKQEVEKIRLDDLFAGRQFDFVKIDTQGSELDVLRGGETLLSHADFILVEISLVEYNIGGARAEMIFSQLDAMGFCCADVTEFHRLAGVHDGNLLQMDFLFERKCRRQTVQAPFAVDASRYERLRDLSLSLERGGQSGDALVLLEHLESLQPNNSETLFLLVRALGAAGQSLKAIEKLSALKTFAKGSEAFAEEIRAQVPAAIQKFNEHITAGQIDEAEKYISSLAALLPGSVELLNSALACNVALGRKQEAAKYASALLNLAAEHSAAQSITWENANEPGNSAAAIDDQIESVISPANTTHPLIRLRDMHDLVSAILCDELSQRGIAQIEKLLAAARSLEIEVPDGAEWEGWVKHYRLAIKAIDLSAILDCTPRPSKEPDVEFASSSGDPLDWSGVKATARRLGAETVFFAAADRRYVDLYARWYISSVLEHCNVPCIVIVQVIGGADNLREIAGSVGIEDARLIFAGDRFDAESVTTKCFDTPPKGLISTPVAHFQSVRFLSLGPVLRNLKLPVFVSDIDLLLQRGVADLLQRCASADIVLNRNMLSTSAGSRFTANLLLVNPTETAARFLQFLQTYLERALGEPEVTRWIDQFALSLARHHLALHATAPRIAYFDTNADINNVMYKSYQENPFRFLSLYHGFDMSSLERRAKAHHSHQFAPGPWNSGNPHQSTPCSA